MSCSIQPKAKHRLTCQIEISLASPKLPPHAETSRYQGHVGDVVYGELDEKARVLVVHHRLPDARVRGNIAVGHLSLTTDVVREEMIGTVRDVEHTVLSTGWMMLPFSETTDVGRIGGGFSPDKGGNDVIMGVAWWYADVEDKSGDTAWSSIVLYSYQGERNCCQGVGWV